jgi:hypothetical protein
MSSIMHNSEQSDAVEQALRNEIKRLRAELYESNVELDIKRKELNALAKELVALKAQSEPVGYVWYHRGLPNFDDSESLRRCDDGKGTPIPLYTHPQPADAGTLRDAERYRWLCNVATEAQWIEFGGYTNKAIIDEAIDAAMKK